MRWDEDPDRQPDFLTDSLGYDYVGGPNAWAPQVVEEEKDYIVLEYLQNGDLKNMITKIFNDRGLIPDRVLWSFWLCLVKQCIGLAYYPRKFHPNRRQNTGNLDEFIPPPEQRWREKRMVHFDFDPLNGTKPPTFTHTYNILLVQYTTR